MIKTAGGTATNYISRDYGDFPDNSGDWSLLLRFKSYGAIVTGYLNALTFFQTTADFNNPYLFIGSASSGQNNIFVEVYDGTNFLDTATYTIADANPHWIGVTYNSATHIVTLIIDGTTIGTVVANMSTLTWRKLFMLGDQSTGAAQSIGVGYLFGWSVIKTIAELTAQAASITPISTANLLFWNPLQTGIDLYDHNWGMNQFLATGTVTTDTSDPLLSIIAGPPTNTTPATALDININSAKFQDTLSSGTAAPETWWKYTAAASDRWLGTLAFGDLITFKPSLSIYEGLSNANSLTPYLDLSPASNGALQFKINSGNTYYFRVARNAPVSPATAFISILKGPNLIIPVGTALINDDHSDDYVAGFLSNTTDYLVYNFASIVAGEDGDILPTGELLYSDEITGGINNIYNGANYSLTISITSIAGTQSRIRTCPTPGNWYLGVSANPPTVRSISKLGVLGSTITLTGSTSLIAGAASNDESKYYFAQFNTNQAIKVWDLVNNVALANLAAGIVNYSISDILYLSNNKIAVMYYKSTVTRDGKLVIYDTGGTQLVNVSIGTPSGQAGPRLGYALDDPTHIVCYLQDNSNGISKILIIKTSDGSITATRLHAQFENAASVSAITNTPPRFGASFSCPISLTRIAALSPSVAKSGLYKITGTNVNNPRISHDVDWIDAQAGTSEIVPIPNPFGETYLAGDE